MASPPPSSDPQNLPSTTHAPPPQSSSSSRQVPSNPSQSPTPPPILQPSQSPQMVPTQGILYPVASSGRPFIPKFFRQQPADQLVTVANPGGFGPRPFPGQVRPLGSADPLAQPPFQAATARSPILQGSQPGSRLLGAMVSGSGRGSGALGNAKAAPFPSPSSEFNGLRELNRDDTVVTVHDRKVRFSDGTSLYSLCRSWVRNGLPKESQTNIGNGVKLLPRPLPIAMTDTGTPEKSESGDEDEGDKYKEEDEGSVEHLSTHELLQRHIKRAKRVRARLRKERLLRIGRYKQRLALLLPSSAEHFRSDTAPGS